MSRSSFLASNWSRRFLNRLASAVFLAVFALIGEAAVASEQPFWWGISTSSYQTEDPGPNAAFKTDWDQFFELGKIKEPRGNGTLSFSKVDRDLETLKGLGVTHYRFGLEWARIEPKPGQYDEAALEHYLRVVKKLKAMGIVPIVCLWHFTFPDWLANPSAPEQSGWLHPLAPARWDAYAKKVVEKFGKDVEIYTPQNEPNGQSLAAYFLGSFPPGEKYSLKLFRESVRASADAYNRAARIIRAQVPAAKIITIQNMIHWERAWWDVFGYFMKLGEEYNYGHLDMVAAETDWIGFNYYYKLKASPFNNPRIDYPEGLELLIERLTKRYKKPVIVTENGVADEGDTRRQEYLTTHLRALERSRAAGHDVRGYFYWSLIDNFEWAYGYKEKFGLYTMSEDGTKLLPKKSAVLYKEAIAEAKKREATKAASL